MRASPNLAGLQRRSSGSGPSLTGRMTYGWRLAVASRRARRAKRRSMADAFGVPGMHDAVITARKLPALIAFQSFMPRVSGQCLIPGGWTAKFGRAYRRITEQILPMFSPSIVAERALPRQRPTRRYCICRQRRARHDAKLRPRTHLSSQFTEWTTTSVLFLMR